MGQVLVAASREPSEEEATDSYGAVPWFGEYFYLYPALLQLKEQTGELIDPQRDAFFSGRHLDVLGEFVSECSARAAEQPASWTQRVGRRPTGDIVYEKARRATVQEFLELVMKAIARARQDEKGVLFYGE